MTDRGIGIGAPGLGKPLPSPGRSCTATITTTQTVTHTWDGYTAADAVTNRARRLRDAGTHVTVTGTTVSWTDPDGGHTEITFTDDT